jgi:tyrosine-protein phosphatase SIW14
MRRAPCVVTLMAAGAMLCLAQEASRPPQWASPMPDQPGLPNLYQVAPGLYRGAQPEEEGFATLKKLGVKTVVNLRSWHSDRKDCERAGLEYVHIAMQAWEGEDDEIIELLRVVTDPSRQPVFVHCKHGADRTGAACAAYRIVVEGWTHEDAIAEMTGGGFGFHPVWKNLTSYVGSLDAERMRQQLSRREEHDEDPRSQ